LKGSMVSERDLKVLKEQLGRPPRGVLAIERRCPAGHPQVIRVYPLIDGEPFPTLFWLTCPEIVKQISRLEHESWIRKLEERIARDPEFRRRYHEAHKGAPEAEGRRPRAPARLPLRPFRMSLSRGSLGLTAKSRLQ